MVYNINYSGSKEAPFALSLAFRTVNTRAVRHSVLLLGYKLCQKVVTYVHSVLYCVVVTFLF